MEKARRAIELLKDAMSFAQPTSLAGALAQFLVGTSFLMDPIESELDDDLKERCFRAGLRCICAASRLLEHLGNVSREEFGTAYYLPKHLDWLSTALGGPVDAAVPPVGEDAPPQPASGLEPENLYDLTKCTLPELARLYEAVQSCWYQVGAHTQAPCFWDGDGRQRHTPAGEILEAEEARLDALLSAIDAEAARRIPADGHDRDERLSLLLRHEIQCSGMIGDIGLLSEADAAWGAK